MSVVKINAVTVPKDRADVLVERFAARAGEVSKAPGFEMFELLRPTDDKDTFLVYTRWASEADFQAWMASAAFGEGHKQSRIKLVDFKVEYGRLYEGEMVRTVLADEISPDSCRLWDMDTGEKMDKDRFRRDMGGVTEAYAEVARRLGIIKEAGGAEILSFSGK